MDKHQEINLINIVETISRKSAKSHFEMKNLGEIEQEIATLSDFLGITTLQAVLFSCIVELSLIRRTNIESIARHFKISPLAAISRMDEFETLLSKGLIRKNSRSGNGASTFNDINFIIPNRVIEGLQKKDSSKIIQKKKFDMPKFLEKVYQLAVEIENGFITTHQFIKDTEALIKHNTHLKFIRHVDTRLVKPVHKGIVFVLSYMYLIGRPEVDLSEFAEDLFDDISDQFAFNQDIIQHNHELIKKEFLELQHSEYGGIKIIKITDQTVSWLFQENKSLRLQDLNTDLLIKPDSLKSRRLYFNNDLQILVDNLCTSLSTRKFKSIKHQLEVRKFSSGITVLLHGESGTGKTEVVYQLARKTQREIMMVDLSTAKNKWFGESEKQVKKIFDDYRMVTQSAKKCPILFINEADGLFSRRQSINSNSASTLHVLNTMQNILLQELESFEGILVATTNLSENLDKAFDRRFLFKIKFTNPDAESRFKIWKARLPELPPKKLRILSEKYALTGGQIENIVKQTILFQMVDNLDLFDSLIRNCEQEKGYGSTNKLGF